MPDISICKWVFAWKGMANGYILTLKHKTFFPLRDSLKSYPNLGQLINYVAT